MEKEFSFYGIVVRVPALCTLLRFLLGPSSSPLFIDAFGLAYLKSVPCGSQCAGPSLFAWCPNLPRPSSTRTCASSVSVAELRSGSPFMPPGLQSLLKPTLMCCCRTQQGSTRPHPPAVPPPLSEGLPPARNSFCLKAPDGQVRGAGQMNRSRNCLHW